MAFTGVIDLDLMILDNLDDNSLKSVCMVNRYMWNLCSSDNFWKRRMFQKLNLPYSLKQLYFKLKGTKVYYVDIERTPPFISFDYNEAMDEIIADTGGEIEDGKVRVTPMEIPELFTFTEEEIPDDPRSSVLKQFMKNNPEIFEEPDENDNEVLIDIDLYRYMIFLKYTGPNPPYSPTLTVLDIFLFNYNLKDNTKINKIY